MLPRASLLARSVAAARPALARTAARRTLASTDDGKPHPYPALAAGHGPWPFQVEPREIHPLVAQVAQEYPTHLHIAVQWGDQDAFGHLNNVLYMRYFESIRMQYLLDFSAYLPAGKRHTFAHPTPAHAGPIVASVTTRYRAQVHYPDTLTYFLRTAESDVAKLRDVATGKAAPAGARPLDRVTLEYVAVSHRLGAIAADGTCSLVTFDYGKNRKVPVPQDVADAVCKWEDEGRRRHVEQFGAGSA
ncbi:hypothetical protein AMAG_06752 [Allomyces macrogynus ATCC 38327]|uniref:YbgC/YbaW family acyl-CoA thioester hydrolase n=1 Tax=Allomyces macrogynus (strain ATCC 38327) TaxID=578462 RepID=A0A0L0SEP4_ALLM3|nr:hypothetical protein AMAG_06752 [Allomyces macrogynus ATCC 38327]|eukprot:KNE60988.1 hypothetical protein AMAG_06752 [Allomyces macrogynus ATCC 38327]